MQDRKSEIGFYSTVLDASIIRYFDERENERVVSSRWKWASWVLSGKERKNKLKFLDGTESGEDY